MADTHVCIMIRLKSWQRCSIYLLFYKRNKTQGCEDNLRTAVKSELPEKCNSLYLLNTGMEAQPGPIKVIA